MAVTVITEADFEFWQTGVDRGLPEQAWRAAASVTGDATGGAMALQVDFQKATNPLSARMWSLELLAATASVAVTGMLVSAFNMGIVRAAAPTVGVGFSVDMAAAAGGGVEALRARDLTFLPWFLGAPRQRGLAAGITIAVSNTDMAILDIVLRGYVWGPRSQTFEGGPRRPVGSVFGA